MPLENLPYPLPLKRGFGSRLASFLPVWFQALIRTSSDLLIGERHQIEVTEPVIHASLGSNAPEHVRIGILADIHYDPLCEAHFVARCVARLNDLEPQVIFLLGDFASYSTRRIDELVGELRNLKTGAGCFAVLGNHDFVAGHEEVHRALQAGGIRVLRNSATRVQLSRDRELALAGFDSATYRCPDFGCLDLFTGNERAILLCHEPDVFVHSALHPKVALQLSGHTHGGQVILPGIGSPLLPRLGKRYVRGHDRRNDSQIYVNRGIGTGHLHVRLGARPEITLLTVINTDG